MRYVMHYELLAPATGVWHDHDVEITRARTQGRRTPERYCEDWTEHLRPLVERGEARNVHHGWQDP